MTTADFNFTTRRGLHDPLAVVAAFAAGVPVPQNGPNFDFTTRRGLHDPVNVLAQFASLLPLPHTGPDFDFTTRRGLHDPANVLAQFGTPPVVFAGIPPSEQSKLTVTRRFNQRLLVRPPLSEAQPAGPKLAQDAATGLFITGLFGPGGPPSVGPTFKNRPIVQEFRTVVADFAGYGTVKLTHAPGARNVTVTMTDDDPPMPGWVTLRKKK